MNTDKSIDKALWLKKHPDVVDAAYPESELTGRILEAAFDVHNTLGCGFLERVYAMRWQLSYGEAGLIVLNRVR
jgi:PD-(D/E)XK nuclease superfamily protein